MSEDIAVKEVKKRAEEARRALIRAKEALAGVEDPRERAELEFMLINLEANSDDEL